VRLLLDTPVAIWWDAGAMMTAAAMQAIRDADEVFVSAASAWEVEIKAALGKIRSDRSVAELCADSGFAELPVLMRHTEALQSLEPLHRDPFDRLLVAQAMQEQLVLVTRDEIVTRYPVATLRA
jgi:PIN domain nuclease of toxin-antitoxin system